MILVDTHSHIYSEEFDGDRAEVVARAKQVGVQRLLLPAIDSQSHQRMLDVVATYPQYCLPMMGLHPTSVNDNPQWRSELQYVRESLCSPPVGVAFCAVGEIGLDYYWSRDFVAEQREAFVEQCRLAAEMDLPIIVHTRNAWEDMCEVICAEAERARQCGSRLRGVMHAFSEDIEVYKRIRACGDFLFGIGGVVTYKKSKVAEAVAEMSLEDIVLETDCPYLTPVPYRGGRNESSYVKYVCERVAGIKNLSPDEVAIITSRNASRMFGFELV